MKQIDVAVNSFKKPESLLYTLMTLKREVGGLVDTVYINDDHSGDGTCDVYRRPEVAEYFRPWKLEVRENPRNVWIKQVYPRGWYPDYMDWKYRLLHFIRFISPKYEHDKSNIRYQNAIDRTDKKYLYIIHDDVKFTGNVIERYLQSFAEDENRFLVGDLGQCWRCRFKEKCSPRQIIEGFRPSPYWPLTPNKKTGEIENFSPRDGYNMDCRINEWSCLVDVAKIREVTEWSRGFFGNYYQGADIGAFIFCKGLQKGYTIDDPLTNVEERRKYYQHPWQGYSGHSVWVDQGQGKAVYNRQLIIDLMRSEFGFEFPQNKG